MEKMKFGFSVVDSPDDEGYYAEIFSIVTGEDVHTTDLTDSADEARILVRAWIKSHGGQGKEYPVD